MKKMLIGGEWVDSSDRQVMPVENPATAQVIEQVPKANVEDARKAIDAANSAKEKIAGMSAWDRYKMLLKTANLLEAHSEEVAKIITHEAGKPIKDSRVEARRAVVTFTYAAEEAKRIYGEVYQPDAFPLPAGNENRLAFSIREPLGVVVAISPFNFPLNLLCHKVAPALAAGNSVIVKPTSETPLVALKLGEFLMEAGCPAGAINVVTGPGSTVGKELTEHPGTDLITFTGSTEVGLGISQSAAKRNKRIILEMGGMDPLIIFDDADLERAADAAARAVFGLAGQVCIATKRIFAQETITQRFSRLLAEKVQRMKVGDPMDETTDIGPVISEGSLNRIHTFVVEAIEKGARIVTGGKRMSDGNLSKGYFYAPTVLEGVTSEMKVMQDEPFGPIGPVQAISSEEEAINFANKSIYGLQASIFTRDLRKALRVARRIRSGGVMINDPTTVRFDNMPFGGVKLSGYGREGVRFALQEMTEMKLININLA